MSEEMKHEDLREGMRVAKYDQFLGWVPGQMAKVTYQGKDYLHFVADGGQYAPSPTWPDSRFREIGD